MIPLKSTTSVVTGASSGIGRATACALAAEGSHVFATGRDLDRLRDLSNEIKQAGGTATVEAFDLKDSEALSAFIKHAADQTGRLDVLVNAAGVDIPGTVASGDVSNWREMFETNVIAVLVGSQAAIAAMRDTGSAGLIVTISSYAGQGDGFRVYGATKAAVNSLCKALRAELEGEHIRVVNIMPGAVATNFGRHFPAEYVRKLLSSFELQSDFETGDMIPEDVLSGLQERARAFFASPADIARAVVYAVTQPTDLSVSEILIGPRKSFPTHRTA